MGRLAKSLTGDQDRKDSKRAARRFGEIAGVALPELRDYQQKAKEGALPGLISADQQTALALRESGVRGPQAALERSIQSGKRAQSLDEALAKYALDDAMRRRDAQLQFYGQKGQTPPQ